MNRYELGRRGEDFACGYLEEHGFTVIGRNVHAGHSEFDIICTDGNKNEKRSSRFPRQVRTSGERGDCEKGGCPDSRRTAVSARRKHNRTSAADRRDRDIRRMLSGISRTEAAPHKKCGRPLRKDGERNPTVESLRSGCRQSGKSFGKGFIK